MKENREEDVELTLHAFITYTLDGSSELHSVALLSPENKPPLGETLFPG
jgi:hypothetical protein